MKIILAFSLIVLTAVSPLSAQQKLKRRPGTLYLLGPVRSVRIERSKITSVNGVLVEGPRVLQATRAYSEDGTNVLSSIYAEERLVARSDETYDRDGKLLESLSYAGDGTLRSRMVNTYDMTRRLVEKAAFRGDGSLLHRIVFRYDGDQRQSEATGYDNHGGVIGTTTSKTTVIGERTAGPDLRERKIESVSLSAHRTISTSASFASKGDGIQEYTQERSDGTWQRSVNASDGKGGGETVNYGRDGSVMGAERFVREFDLNGNLLKISISRAKGDSQNFEPTEVIYWTVTYYEQK